MTNESSHRQCAELRIAGMHCASCEIALERKLKKVPGVLEVDVDHRTGKASIVADSSAIPNGEQIEAVIKEAGYQLEEEGSPEDTVGLDRERGIWKVRIDGMTCQSCENLLRQRLKNVPGVRSVSVHYESGIANIHLKRNELPQWKDLRGEVESVGYQLRHLDEFPLEIEPPHRKWMEIGGALLAIFALYKLLKALNIITIASSAASASTLGGIFLIGLVAGTSSCLAVTGGLLLTVAAKYNEVNKTRSPWEKFKPLLSFNVGRLASYFLLGGLVGLIGQSITLTPRMTGYMNIAVALVMLSLALSILGLIPKGSFPIRPPRKFSHWIASLSENPHPAAPFTLGALTFFLPCGFTQSLQLVALASGSFFSGALTMFIFALGTLPALVGLSAISSTAQGIFSRVFLRFSGVLVFVLALYNLNNGLLLTGVDAAGFLASVSPGGASIAYAGNDPNVTQTSDGQQIIHMRVTPYGYEPNSFTIEAGKPTWVYAKADRGISGCTSVLTAPNFGLTKYLQEGQENQFGPIQNPTQDFSLTCSMGMVRARVYVVGVGKNAGTVVAQAPSANAPAIPADAQIVDLTWTSSGYSPRVIEVAQGRPTAVRISASAPTGGCMSTVVFPQFNQSAFVPQPGSPPITLVLNTEQAQPGDYPITCGMGGRMAFLRVKTT